MRRKALFLVGGVVALGLVATAFATTPRKTAFESGYGLKLSSETVGWENGVTRTVFREYVSDEEFTTVAERLHRKVPNQTFRSDIYCAWEPSEGSVMMGNSPVGIGYFKGVPTGFKTFLRTISTPPLTPFQKFAFRLGVRI